MMPRVVVSMTNGDEHVVREMPTEDALDLVEDFQKDDSPVITLLFGELGINDTIHLARAHVVSIIVEGSDE